MSTAVVLLTRDLRVHDNPALHAACTTHDAVVPLFVEDVTLRATRFGAAAARRAFLDECLVDLDDSLRERGGALIVRRGEVVAETAALAREVGATTVFASADVTPYARRREERLAAELRLELVNGHAVVPPGEVAPVGGDFFQVFSPYHRAWSQVPFGDPLPAPSAVRPPESIGIPPPLSAPPSGGLARGGEREAIAAARRWLCDGLARYGDGGHDDLAIEGTSRLSPYLHLGCVSARSLAVRAAALPGGEPFVRQLCWRDFYAQLLWARPDSLTADFRTRGDVWIDDAEGLARWQQGMTGFPLVDAGMRQLAAEGWMHNRARMVVASFLVKDLGIDWREGAAHFFDLLLDGDAAQNVGNWQWVAGTGVDSRPNRVYNPTRQREKLDPDGVYVRRHVPELADVPIRHLDEPGLLAPGYPAPIVDHADAVAAFRARRGL